VRCPFCGSVEDRVVDSRASREGRAVRRRRECLACARRFTTYEYIESLPRQVVKRDGLREPYDRQKILRGLLTACKKRPIQRPELEALVDRLEERLDEEEGAEVESRRIGEIVMEELGRLDPVAYVRFASVYRKFQDVTDFADELRELSAGRPGRDAGARPEGESPAAEDPPPSGTRPAAEEGPPSGERAPGGGRA
jgi:transcriptional repressor NrdR